MSTIFRLTKYFKGTVFNFKQILTMKQMIGVLSASSLAWMFLKYHSFSYAQSNSCYGFLKSAATVSPHPDKAYKGGEDALAFKHKMITVADGVGGWSSKGVDVAKYSKQLMRMIVQVHNKNPELSPLELLYQANKLTTEKGTRQVNPFSSL